MDPMGLGQQPISDEQYGNLQDLLSSVKEQGAAIEGNSFMIENQKQQAMRDAIKQIFDELASNGIDLNDQASVATFLTTLQQTKPDLYQLFEEAMAILLGESNEMNNEAVVPEELSGAPEGMGESLAEGMAGPGIPPELLSGQPPEGGTSIPLP